MPQKVTKRHNAAVFTRKETATYKQRVEILDWHHAHGKNQTKTARHFDEKYPNLKIKQPLVSSWVKNEKEIRQEYDQDITKGTFKRMQQTSFPDVTEALELWVSKAAGDGLFLSGEVLRQKWHAFADIAGIPKEDRIGLSNGWLESFKKRNNLKLDRRHGEAASADPKDVTAERERMRKLTQKYAPEDTYNGDETGLFYG